MKSDDLFAIIFTALLILGLAAFFMVVTDNKPPHFAERPTPVIDAVTREALKP
jgi:hypothetical protein